MHHSPFDDNFDVNIEIDFLFVEFYISFCIQTFAKFSVSKMFPESFSSINSLSYNGRLGYFTIIARIHQLHSTAVSAHGALLANLAIQHTLKIFFEGVPAFLIIPMEGLK